MLLILELLVVNRIVFKWKVREGMIYNFIMRLSVEMQLTNWITANYSRKGI